MEDRDAYELEQLEDMLAGERQKVQQLTMQLERANSARCKDQSEIARYHAALIAVSALAEDADDELSTALGADVLEHQWDVIDLGRSAVRKIRDIVG